MSAFERHLHGRDPALRTVLRAARILAATDVAVLVCGEPGTGKETLARAIHADSRRCCGPFVRMHCASLTDETANSLLFGHRRGAFPGADRDHPGHLADAHGGTLFLDEVSELPRDTQAKLLRFIESAECLPAGALAPVHLDVRIVAATTRELAAEAAAHRFSRDLYLRLSVVPLTLPPLHERGADIPILLDEFCAQAAKRYDLSPPRFQPAAIATLRRYAWPGNVRELRNLAERLVILFGGRAVGPENLPREIRSGDPVSMPASNYGFILPEQGIVLEALEADILRQALARTAGNRTHAARLLGISRDTLLYRLKKHALR